LDFGPKNDDRDRLFLSTFQKYKIWMVTSLKIIVAVDPEGGA
jgi:hypothetical protein